MDKNLDRGEGVFLSCSLAGDVFRRQGADLLRPHGHAVQRTDAAAEAVKKHDPKKHDPKKGGKGGVSICVAHSAAQMLTFYVE